MDSAEETRILRFDLLEKSCIAVLVKCMNSLASSENQNLCVCRVDLSNPNLCMSVEPQFIPVRVLRILNTQNQIYLSI